MGNCTRIMTSTVRMRKNAENVQNRTKTNTATLYGCDTSADHVNGEIQSKMAPANDEHPSRIPVLRSSNYQSKLADKTMYNCRSLSSHIPVNNTATLESKKIDQNQTSNGIKHRTISSFDVTDISSRRPRRERISTKNQSKEKSNSISSHKNIVKPDTKIISEMSALSPNVNVDIVDENRSKYLPEIKVQIAEDNIDNGIVLLRKTSTNGRPLSISPEADAFIRRSPLKTSSNDLETSHDLNAIIQDVSSLKLMLHKLKRYIVQDGDDTLLDITNDSLFRLCSRPLSDVKSLSREELERKCELLIDQNATLEKILQSREKVIASLQGDMSHNNVYLSRYNDN